MYSCRMYGCTMLSRRCCMCPCMSQRAFRNQCLFGCFERVQTSATSSCVPAGGSKVTGSHSLFLAVRSASDSALCPVDQEKLASLPECCLHSKGGVGVRPQVS